MGEENSRVFAMLQDIPFNVQCGVRSLLDASEDIRLLDFTFSTGGCINHGGRLRTTAGDFFLKWNDARKFESMFKVEAAGLQLLRDTNTINIPEVLGYGVEGAFQFLLLAFIEQSYPSSRYWQKLGRQLALLHQAQKDYNGLDHDNYMGSLKQYNQRNSSWSEFFIAQRLSVQVELAAAAGRVDNALVNSFQKLYTKLPSLLPEETPSLLHGDLWGGNVMRDESGDPVLIDPAVYYGSREIDLAATRLFGEFDSAFYGAYEEAFPLHPGHAERIDLYNLYPLLVHLNLFGSSYLPGIREILNRFL
ncbi:MAG: fructosamine kinase family protein [Cyclobacteriaceae bacterium]|nr:fructosamine kinase family protein [Cyclobacteriaceae bacterium]MDH4294946.1 fructosamine kinase family protein [Cyclobacteriaceae bacterium]